MRTLSILSVLFMLGLAACKPSPPVRRQSYGHINSILLVMDNNAWKGAPGDTIRKYFARDYEVLPQREPLFSISQVDPKVFDKNFFIQRNILIIKTGDSPGVKFIRDRYAKPQLMVVVQGKDYNDIYRLLRQNADRIIRAFRQNEKALIASRKFKNFVGDSLIRKELHIAINIPDYFKLIVHKNGFFWYRHDLKFGSKNILLYKIPLKNLDSLAEHVPQMRDSIGKLYIPGPLAGSYVRTERTFSPVQHKVKINGIRAIESRGLWEMENDYMAGPYVNYILPLPKYNIAVVLEGFVYLPMENKRNLMTELEAILETARPVD